MSGDGGVWRALARPRFLISSWPYRALLYLLSTVPVGLAALLALVVLGGVGALTAIALLGIPILAAAVLAGIPAGVVERYRLRLLDPAAVPDPHTRTPPPGLWGFARARLQETATWRELAAMVLLAVVLWPLDLLAVATCGVLTLAPLLAPVLLAMTPGGAVALGPVQVHDLATAWLAVPVGLAVGVISLYVLTALAAAQAAVVRVLLAAPQEELVAVVASRARLVDAFEAEQRRIERDLHDGAQQRLVAMSMNLGVALLDLPPGPGADAVAEAHKQAGEALADLRELIRGVHPVVLTERGFAAAVADIADRGAIPVEVAIEVPRLPAQIESAAYFAVSEALANVARHSGAEQARVAAHVEGATLVVEITDDGRGGADPTAGTGLVGLADRIAVVAGTLSVSSPPGGPTLLRVEIPCPG